MWGPKRLNLLWFLRYGFPQMARYYHSIYLSTIYLSTLNIHRSIYRCWQGKFPEYTHFVETSSTGWRDMLGHFGGKLCHRERGRCLARHQMYLPLTFMRVYIGAGKASFLSIRILSRLLPRVVGIC